MSSVFCFQVLIKFQRKDQVPCLKSWWKHLLPNPSICWWWSFLTCWIFIAVLFLRHLISRLYCMKGIKIEKNLIKHLRNGLHKLYMFFQPLQRCFTWCCITGLSFLFSCNRLKCWCFRFGHRRSDRAIWFENNLWKPVQIFL